MTSKASKLILTKKGDKLYNKESTLVFNSAKEKLVVGRFEGDEFISLDQEALDLCEKYGYKYDETLVETEEEVEEKADAETPEEEEAPEEKAPKKPVKAEPKKAGLTQNLVPSERSKKAPPKESSEGQEDKEDEPKQPEQKKVKTESVSKAKTEEKKAPVPSSKPASLQASLQQIWAEMGTLFSTRIEALEAPDNSAQDSERVAELEKEVESLKQELAKKDKKIKALVDCQ